MDAVGEEMEEDDSLRRLLKKKQIKEEADLLNLFSFTQFCVLLSIFAFLLFYNYLFFSVKKGNSSFHVVFVQVSIAFPLFLAFTWRGGH